MTQKIDLLIKLLRETTSISVISSFLKGRDLHHSASGWDELIDVRLLPAIEAGKITLDDLISLLRDVEEHGKQHIFLFKCSEENAKKYLSSEHIAAIASNKDYEKVMTSPSILDQPEIPTITDIRVDNDEKGEAKSLVIKVVERRAFMKALDVQTDGNIVTKRYERILERAVNVICLNQNGCLEMKIQSHTNSSEYQLDVARFWSLVSNILDKVDFEELSLQKAKNKLWEDNANLSKVIRYSKFVVKNLDGVSLDISCGPEDQTITDSEGAVESINNFIEHDGHFDKSNIWFLAVGGLLSKDLHVLMPKQGNEFAITANCTKVEYNYVISKLKALNI